MKTQTLPSTKFILAIVAILLAFAIVQLSQQGAAPDSRFLWIFSLFVFSLAGPIWTLLKPAKKYSWMGKFDPLNPAFFFPICYSIYYGFELIKSPNLNNLFLPVVVGLSMYYLGILIGHLKPPRIHYRTGPINSWDRSLFYYGLLVLFLISISALLSILVRQGLVGLVSNVETERTVIVSRVGGYIYNIGLLVIVPIILSFVYIFSISKKAPHKTGLLFLIAFSLGLLALLGYRAWVIIPTLSLAVLVNYYKREILVPLSLFLFISTVAYIVLYGAFRQTGQLLLNSGIFVEKISHELSLGPAALRLIMDFFPDSLPYLKGNAVLMPILSILPGQNPILGGYLKETMNLNFIGGGFGASLLGGFYVDFGMIGIIAGMFFIGLIYSWLYRKVITKRNELWIALYAYMVIYLLNSLRIMFLSDSFLIYLIVSTMLIFNWICSSKKKTINQSLPLHVRVPE